MSYQKVTGPLMANSHPGSYCGQDAYSDMLVVDNDNFNKQGGLSHKGEFGYNERTCGYGLQRSTNNFTRGGGDMTLKNEQKGGDEMMDVSTSKTVVRRLTPL